MSDRFVNPDGFVPTQCRLCHRLNDDGGKLTCLAFPKGIPQQVLENKLDHRYPIEGDGGYRFSAPHDAKDSDIAALFVVLNEIPQVLQDEPSAKAKLTLRYGIRFPDDQ